jgi:hypothetical protein
MAGPTVKARGNLLPLVRMSDDQVRFGMPQSLIDLWRNVTLPRDVLAGTREPTPEAGLGFALDWGMGGLGSSALPGMVPEGELAGMFVGPRAANFNPQAAQAAEDLAATGKSPHLQAKDTGYFVGHDDIARTEISDHLAKMNPVNWREKAGSSVPLSQVLEHPRLYEEYPELAHLPVREETHPRYFGAYDPATGGISVNRDLIEAEGLDMRETLLHEVQHAVQAIEGFDPGSNPQNAPSQTRQILNAEKPPGVDALLARAEQNAMVPVARTMLGKLDTMKPIQVHYGFGQTLSDLFGIDYPLAQKLALDAFYDPAVRASLAKQIDDLEAQPLPPFGDDAVEWLRRDAVQKASTDKELYHARGGEEEARRTVYRADLTPRQRHDIDPDMMRGKKNAPVQRKDRYILPASKRPPYPKPKGPPLKAGWNKA